jgi:hypothetical protein
MYGEITARVKHSGELSRLITEKQGIRQGGLTSAEAFKAKSNSFLNSVRCHPDSFRIGSIPVGIPTVADDNCLIANSKTAAQTLIYIAEKDAARDRYLFSTTKSKVVRLQERARVATEAPSPFVMNNSTLECSEQETHLGLLRTTDGKCTAAVEARIQTGRRTAYSMMGAGFHGLNGISPEVSMHLLQVYVMPTILYGLEALKLSDSDIVRLEKNLQSYLRQIQHLPTSTARPALYLLSGCLPAEAQYHIKVLTFFNGILLRPGTVEYQVITRQLLLKDMNANSWTVMVKQILAKYGLPPGSCSRLAALGV